MRKTTPVTRAFVSERSRITRGGLLVQAFPRALETMVPSGPTAPLSCGDDPPDEPSERVPNLGSDPPRPPYGNSCQVQLLIFCLIIWPFGLVVGPPKKTGLTRLRQLELSQLRSVLVPLRGREACNSSRLPRLG